MSEDTNADGDDETLTLETGDACPAEECDKSVKTRTYAYTPQREESDRVGPLAEAYCLHHGIVEQI